MSPPDLGRIRESLTNLVLALETASRAANTPLPDSVTRELTLRRVALVGFADAEADRICGALERVGGRPHLFRIHEPTDSDSVRDCEIVMVHVRPETRQSPWLAPGTVWPNRPLILVGAREQLLSLDPTVQSRAKEFLIDGWQPEEALMRLRFALPSFAGAEDPPPAQAKPNDAAAASPIAISPAPVEDSRKNGAQPEVLIADDDEIIRKVLHKLLSSHGMTCVQAATGSEALQMVIEHSPRTMLLDVNLPGMDGFQVLAAIRRQNLPTRILMVTARQQEQDIVRGFQLGADDYVVKPFNSRELVMRIRRLLLAQ